MSVLASIAPLLSTTVEKVPAETMDSSALSNPIGIPTSLAQLHALVVPLIHSTAFFQVVGDTKVALDGSF